MPRNMQTLSRPIAVAAPLQAPVPPSVPSIRLISATPSAAGNSSTSSVTNYAIDTSWGSIPTPLAPKADSSATRKRLVPKKSKLSMLGVGAGREKERGNDFSDVVRRVGGSTSTRAPEPLKLSEPSRARFNSLDSGILLNSPSTVPGFAQQQALPNLDAPEPSPPLTSSRSGTPTAGGLLAPPSAATSNSSNQGSIAIRAMRSVRSMARIGSWAQLKNSDENARMGSVRVKEKKEKEPKEKKVKDEGKKKKKKKENENEEKDGEDVKKKKTKAKKDKERKEKEKEAAQTIRMSTSSFEIGAASPMPPEKSKSLGKKKHSILGLGLPSAMTMRLPNVRNGSTASSVMPQTVNRLSVDSAHIMKQGRDRAGSVMSTSTTSSLRPLSTTSSMSGSRLSSGSSVRWDEDCLENVKELRRRERREKEKERSETATEKTGKTNEKESRRTSEGRRRTPLSEVFPIFGSESPVAEERPQLPIVTVEAATCDGHGAPDDHSILEEDDELPQATPVKRARPRPLSEQLLGKSRPKPMYEGEDGVLSILDAATNDLAQLINHLDLEATPGTPDMTPLRPSPALLSPLSRSRSSPGAYELDSPTKNKSKNLPMASPARKSPHNMPSISSLRPYAQSRKNTMPLPSQMSLAAEHLIGQQITPWPTLLQNLSPVKPAPKKTSPAPSQTPVPTLRMTHKRTLTPAPEPEPSPVFMPLRPAKSRNALATLRATVNPAVKKGDSPLNEGTIRAPSLRTFGSVSSSRSMLDGSPTPSPVFKRVDGHRRQRSSLVPIDVDEHSGQRSRGGSRNGDAIPIPPETRRILGMSGTMGGSDVSGYAVPELDASDPDSDIPDELQHILSNQSDDGDTMSYHDDYDLSMPSSPVLAEAHSGPPVLELPTFHAKLIDDEDNHADIDIDAAGNSSDEDYTKKSFDFTGEIKKLNESGASDRRSFVEQLENAFRTPAKIDLRGFGNTLLKVDIPPVPKLPLHLVTDSSASSSSLDSYSGSGLVDMKEPTLLGAMSATDDSAQTMDKSRFEMFSGSQILDLKEPTLLLGSDSLTSGDSTHDIVISDDSASRSLRASSSSGSRPSDGQLNTAFKFGGLPKTQPSKSPQQEKPQTLSDIIPPPSHVRSLSSASMMDDDDSVLKSIFAKVSDIPQPRPRVNSDSSAKPRYRHSRHSSGMSFAGLDSFDEVRRGFEFSIDRPFYPPPVARRNARHNKQDSLFSIASVSSYGRAHDFGLPDPFDYGLPSLRERPSSEDMTSMSMSVDDTFSFLDHQPRRRVESDASSFYFKAPSQSFARGHRRHESNMSISSQAPPVSLFNRGFGAHRRNDSSSSAQSVALSYAMHGASGGRAVWARHRQESSMDSVMSDFSAMRLGRPGIGDKMFDTAVDHGVPLTSISASPPESISDDRFGNRSSFDFDSIMDNDRRSSFQDSLFENTNNRSSVSSDSVFGRPVPKGNLQPPPRYRPLSVISMNSVHSPAKEDDTMISMLGGGHVRRRSIDASPCARIEKRKHSSLQGDRGYNDFQEYRESPNKARIVEKPSIASTSSYTFGGERMIKAQRGLLERQSLEDSCLVASGEDMTTSLQSIHIFSRPGPKTRSRSSTCTSSSGGDTPPLSISDGFSSMDEGSQSSIDLSHVDFALANATHPMSTIARNRTIEEEISYSPSPNRSVASKASSPTTCQPIFIVEPETAAASPEVSIWDDENGIIALRKYYALRNEAQTTVTESKETWLDTPFSVFALQSFQPPRHPAGMQALLDHSVQNYGPLPSELRPRRMRSRTSSRPSPYPQARVVNKVVPPSPEKVHPAKDINTTRSFGAPVLQQIPVNKNLVSAAAPALDIMKPSSPLVVDIEPKRENAFGLAPHARPRVASTARRSALGWSKRSSGKTSTDQKENTGQGTIMTPGESLRINRPRPRGRPTPASTARPIRV
ncbi:hypothetical protein DXG03_006381 [Asterophora parasitica]|uniref:Uncharacterized protein n=1 Tax=Asterophora parasitica TaxID=117018 RepID=A0A9P7G2Q6_9AGAR|nr:hypothetical protein DXG03_006381 [Asterophora parasitica]